jgi:hypothetical protein
MGRLSPGREEEPTMIAQERTAKRQPRCIRRIALATLLILVAAAAALLAAACSSAPRNQAGPGRSAVASLPGHGGVSPGPPSLTEARSDQDMINFTRCMRSHGVPMPDPFHRPGHAGLTLDMPTQDEATRPAYAACTHYIQEIIQLKQAGTAAQAAPHLAALTRYAQCMRGHDIAMLDPAQDGELNLGNVPGMTSDFGRYSPQFRAADTACRHLLPPRVHDNGTGP